MLTIPLKPELSQQFLNTHGLKIKKVRIINRVRDMCICLHRNRRFLIPTKDFVWEKKKS